MRHLTLLSALVAIGTTVVSAATCTEDITISEATPTISCEVVDADITVDEGVSGNLVIDGPKQLKGDFTITNASALLSVSSTSINSIGGTFKLDNLELLNSVDMAALRSVNEIQFIKLLQLNKINFGTSGVTKVNSIQVSDTFISDLTGLNVATVENFQIDNNKKMTTFDSDLVNITGQLIINNNGLDMQISMKVLELASEIQISQVKAFEAPALTTISESIKFDENPELESIYLPNVTEITNDLSFLNNDKLVNISMPLLESISGGFTIQNNTAMETIDGFPELETVSGAIILRGNFSKVELPSLKDVKGSVTVTSTTDISDFCDFFDDLKKNGAVRGDETCTSNNQRANEDDGNDGESNSGSGKGNEDAAGMVSVNMGLLGLAGVVALAQLF